MLYHRPFFCILTILMVAVNLVTSSQSAHGKELCGTVAAVHAAGMPHGCVAVRFTAPGDLKLYRRDVCQVVSQGRSVGKAIVLLSGDHLAVFYVLFARPIQRGDSLVVAQRRGYVQEDAFLMRIATLAMRAHSDDKKASTDSPWNGLHYRSQSDYAPNLVHFWAATLHDSTLSGVDDSGYWRSLRLATPAIPVMSSDGRLHSLSTSRSGDEMDAVVGESGGRNVVVAAVLYPPVSISMLLSRLAPRVPLTYDAPVPLVDLRPQTVQPSAFVRQLRGCRVASLDVMNARITLRSFNGELLRANLPEPLVDLGTGSRIEPGSLMTAAPMDVVCYSDGRASTVLALGSGRILAEVTPRLVGKVIGRADGAHGGSYYKVALTRRDGVKPRDIVSMWRKGLRLGQGMLTRSGPQGLLFARAGTPALRAGDSLAFERRSSTAYIDADRFLDPHVTHLVRRTTDPREAFVVDAYAKDARPVTPDLYYGGPFQTGEPPMRLHLQAAPGLESEDGLVLMGSLVVMGYHQSLGKIKESKLQVFVQHLKEGSLVHFRFQFHPPFDWGDPLGVLETNITLDREEFKALAAAWDKAVDVWRLAPEDMVSKGYHGNAKDAGKPGERYVELTSMGRGDTKALVMAFTDPRPIFSKKNLFVKKIDAILPEADVNAVSTILERVKAHLGW